MAEMREVCGARCTADDHDPGDEWVCTLAPHADYIDHAGLVPGGWHSWPNTASFNVEDPEERLDQGNPSGHTAAGLRAERDNLRRCLDHVRIAAALHYAGGAFEPEHMRRLANLATAGLNGEEIPGLPDPERVREDAAVWSAWLDAVAVLDAQRAAPPP